MDERNQPPAEVDQSGPLGRLVEDELTGLPGGTGTEERGERPNTRTEPSTGPADYAQGTPEHHDDRED